MKSISTSRLTAILKRYRVAIILVTLVTIGVVAAILTWEPPAVFYITVGWFSVVAGLLWWGNRFINSRFDRILPWKKWGNFRFFILLLLGLIYLLIVINASYILLKVTVTSDPPTTGQIFVTNIIGAAIFIPLFSIYFSLHFLRHWRKSELEAEKIQKENIRTQLNLLRTQLDPHFLFNNLNILSALIDQDQSRSKQFVSKLADVYRALMKRDPEDLVTIRDELKFLDAYIFLLQTRFGDYLQFELQIDRDARKVLPPMTLQLLVENAIKHNVVSEKNRLSIVITDNVPGDYLAVRNSLLTPPKTEDRKGVGLGNIRERYAFFTDLPVKVIKTENTFEVQIPLLTLDNAS